MFLKKEIYKICILYTFENRVNHTKTVLNLKNMTSTGAQVFYLRCLFLEIIPSLVLNIFQNLTSFKIGAYRLVLIKQNVCTNIASTRSFIIPRLNIFLFPYRNVSLKSTGGEKLTCSVVLSARATGKRIRPMIGKNHALKNMSSSLKILADFVKILQIGP